MVDNSAGSMISSATGIFLSFLHAKVGRERLVYFIVSSHIVLRANAQKNRANRGHSLKPNHP